MHRRLTVPTLALLLLTLLAGCGGTSAPRPSPVHASIALENERGVRAHEARRYGEALQSFREALRLSRSIDDPEGESLSLLNIVRSCRMSGQCGDTGAELAEGMKRAASYPDLLGGFSLERARQALLANHPDEAYDIIGEVEQIARATGASSGLLGQALNLKAGLELRRNRAADAARAAAGALQANRDAGQGVEEATSLRLLGEAATASGDWAGARSRCSEALHLDRKLGESLGVGYDLLCLCGVALGEGDMTAAVEYLQRAGMVAENAGLPELVRAVKAAREKSRQ